MTNPNLITKYMAWMDLYYEGNNLELIENHLTENGERCIESFIPLVDKTVQGIHKKIEKAFDIFFENVSQEIDEYIQDKSDIKERLDMQIKTIEEQTQNEFAKRKNEYQQLSEFESLETDILEDQFNKDLDEAMDNLINSTRDVAQLLDEDLSRIYIKVLSRDYFEEDESEKRISLKMQSLCSKELRKSNLILLFTKCRVLKDTVVVIGIIEQL